MKFIKQNLTLVICGVVVILSIGIAAYAALVLTPTVESDAASRFKGTQGTITQLTNTPLPIPGLAQIPKGVPTPNLLDGKKEANDKMAKQAAAIVKSSAEANRNWRVEVDEKTNTVTPLLEGKKEVNFLPVIAEGADSMQFKSDYGNVFARWITTLAGSTAKPPLAPVPPRSEDLSTAFTDFQTKRNANRPPNMPAPAPGSGDQQEQTKFYRNKIMETALGIHMYIDPGAFQVRPWLATDSPPTEQNMFEALVDTWYQSDVVAAIAAVNDAALKGKEAAEKNVGSSPVKRLIKLTVGNDAQVSRLGNAMQSGPAGSGPMAPLFFLPSTAAGATGDAAAPPAGTVQPNTTDLSRSMTGRAGGADYDVVLMQVSMDIDPSYLNKFIDQLYRRNMGYTVLSVKTRTVDPLDRVSNGFIYGDTQVAEVEVLVEGLLFRTWTQPIMPAAVRTQLGIPADAPKP